MLINIGMAIGGAMLLLAILGLGLATIMPGIDRWSKRFFTCFFAILAFGMVFYIVDIIAYGNPSMMVEEITASLFESVAILTLIAMMPLYLLHCCGENWLGCRDSISLREMTAPR